MKKERKKLSLYVIYFYFLMVNIISYLKTDEVEKTLSFELNKLSKNPDRACLIINFHYINIALLALKEEKGINLFVREHIINLQ